MASDIPYIYEMPTTFHIGDGVEHQPLDKGFLNLPLGTGVIWEDGKRYRVIDRWFSFDRHGRFDAGLHIFLEEVSNTEEDFVGRLEPDYFGG